MLPVKGGAWIVASGLSTAIGRMRLDVRAIDA